MPFDESTALDARVAALQAEVDRTRQLIETVPAVVMRVSLDGVIEYINRVLPEYASRQPQGQSIYSFAPPSQHEVMRSALERARETLQPTSFESVAQAPDGTRDWYVTNVGPVLEGGRLVGFALVSADVSRVHDAEARLAQSRVKMQLALDAGNVGVWSWDRRSDAVEWDEKLNAMFGLTPEQSPRTVQQYMALIPADQKEAMGRHIERALQTGLYPDFELRADQGDTPRWFIIKGGVIRDDEGQITGLLGGVIDVTERRQTEELLRQAQKLQAVGQLAAGVAHNFNNMLAVILPALELLKGRAAPADQELIDDALTSAVNAAQLVQQLMVFSRTPPAAGRKEALADVVRRAVQLCRQIFAPWVALELRALDAASWAEVDSAAMEQAVMNLLLNARDALEPGGARPTRIEVSAAFADPDTLRRRYPDLEGRYVELKVQDTGAGMSEATRLRIMEPFFSTKGAGRGTGLGLSTAWATVRAHHGFLECSSELGQGTTFSLLLPARGEPLRLTHAPSSVPNGAGQAVLLVDDQDAVRRSHAALLTGAGFRVLHAASGAEALEVGAREHVDVVLLDYSMPGLSAEETLAGLRRQRPRLPIICLSGLATTLEGASAQLLKPVSHEALVR
ncbi:MAG: PAS domain S-box protein, partial [Myxococcus sp.]|nr:PAS domain S-box protein [Myxococcus sp.]